MGRKGEATRARVIEAARGCISELGYHGASSNEIARRAGITWGVIQYHFGTRESVLLAVVDHAIEEAFGQQVFTGLESFGQFFAHGVGDDAWACETDEGFGFGDDDVAEHGVACGDAACGGVGQYADK